MTRTQEQKNTELFAMLSISYSQHLEEYTARNLLQHLRKSISLSAETLLLSQCACYLECWTVWEDYHLWIHLNKGFVRHQGKLLLILSIQAATSLSGSAPCSSPPESQVNSMGSFQINRWTHTMFHTFMLSSTSFMSWLFSI